MGNGRRLARSGGTFFLTFPARPRPSSVQRSLLGISLALLAGGLVASSVQAEDTPRATAAEEDGDPRVEVELITDRARVAPGESLRVGVRFVLDPHWHVYFRNPGEAAIGTEVLFAGEGAEVGALRWPTPERLRDPSGTIVTFGYEQEVILGARAQVAEDAQRVHVTADADFLVCKVDCIPGRVVLDRTIPVGPSEPSAAAPALDAYEAALPLDLDAAGRPALEWEPPRLEAGASATVPLRIRCDDCAPPAEAAGALFPDRLTGLRAAATEVRREGGGLVVDVRLEAGPDGFEDAEPLTGLLVLQRAGAPLAMEVALPLEASDVVAAAPAESAPAAAPLSLAWVLLLAFVGGVILNGMPCLLPVLALKVVALGQLAHEDGRSRTSHVLAYTAGILAAMLGLAAVVLGLRAVGTQVGWGFQLQSPVFATVLAAALVVFALGLFGVWTLRIDGSAAGRRLDRRTGLGRSFGEGLLAVLLATPCSAPFLGTAVGFAFAASGGVVLAVFLAIGLGLAAPFALVALVPGARRLVPQPGAWMESMQKVLGFLLLGTAVFLLWVVGQLTGVDGMTQALVFLVVLAGAVFLATGAWVSRAIAVALVVAAAFWAFPLPERPTEAANTDRAWTPERVETLVAEGRPVFVDFTAQWCITCKANENLVLSSDAVRDAFAETGTELLVADWTERDETIRQVLERHGKAGVPLYLLYRPGASAPEVLPELLTEGIVTGALRGAAPDEATGDPR